MLRGRDLAIANLVWACEPDRGAPVLGIDLVALGAAGVLVAANLSPTLPETTREHERQLAEMARIRAIGAALPDAGPVESPYAELFTPHHVHARVATDDPASAETVPTVLRALAGAFVRFASGPPQPRFAGAATEGFRRNMDAHRRDVRVSSVLARAFGEEVGARLVRDLMFPVVLPDRPGRA